MKYFLTGGAGFIGSNLADRLLALDERVVVFDNLSTGQQNFLNAALGHPRFEFVYGDALDLNAITQAMEGADFVFHLAANADVRFGTSHPRKDLEQNTIATWNVLEAMRRTGVGRIAFPSTGSIYGEPHVFPTPEDAPFPVQTSLYGASKLAAEGFIQAYAEGFGIEAHIFRFVSILGPRYSHGHVYDFHKQLMEHPDRLYVLGNGLQRKSYLAVADCIDAMLLAISAGGGAVQCFNLGHDTYCAVNDSIGWICDYLGLEPRIEYAGGERGWTGDSPFIFLDCSRMRALGWRPKQSIRDAVVDTVRYLEENRRLYESHA